MNAKSIMLDRHRKLQWAYLFLAAGCLLLAAAFLVGISDNPPGIISLLAGFFALAMGLGYRFVTWGRRQAGRQLLYWAPRALCITMAVFISMFALDVFDEGKGFWQTTLDLAIHLIPTYIVLILLAVAWRWEWVGAAMFITLGVLYPVLFWGRFHLSVYVIMSGPLLLIGILFLLNWRWRRRPATKVEAAGGGQ